MSKMSIRTDRDSDEMVLFTGDRMTQKRFEFFLNIILNNKDEASVY